MAAWRDRGDQAAFGELVRRHGRLMARVAVVALGSSGRRDPGLVQDAVQEASIRLLSALRGYRGDAPLSAFIASLARRAALDELRKALRHKKRAELASSHADTARPGPEDPASGAERTAAALAVLSRLDALKEPDRSLLYLRDAEGLDIASLAAMFRLPQGTVKSKLARARAAVRADVISAWGEGGTLS